MVRTQARRAKRIALALILALAIWSFGIEPASLTVRHETLHLAGWSGPSVTLAIAGDLHVGSPWCGVGKLRRVVDALNDAHADAIILLGDYVIQDVIGGRFVAPDRIAAELRRLRGPTFAVLGNHDGWYDARKVDAALRGAGIIVLKDESSGIFAGVTCNRNRRMNCAGPNSDRIGSQIKAVWILAC